MIFAVFEQFANFVDLRFGPVRRIPRLRASFVNEPSGQHDHGKQLEELRLPVLEGALEERPYETIVAPKYRLRSMLGMV
jgi:hypothetical protein